MEFLGLFLSPHFAEKSLVASQNDGCFLTLLQINEGLSFYRNCGIASVGESNTTIWFLQLSS